MATRYDQKTKDQVVAFIKAYNDENGRGGQSAAAKKWKLNPITVKAWMGKAGLVSPGKSAKKKSSGGRKPQAATRQTSKAKTGSLSGVLTRMAGIQDQIASLQVEYDSLKSKL